MPNTLRILAALIAIACIGSSGCMLEQDRENFRNAVKVQSLVKQLKAKDPFVRRKAAYALCEMNIHAREAILPLADVVRTDADIDVKIAAIAALESISNAVHFPSAGAIELLGNIINSDMPLKLRLAAISAVPAITYQSREGRTLLAALLDDADPDIRAEALDALGRVNALADEINPLLIARLKDDNATVRARAAAALRNANRPNPDGEPPPKDVITALTDALADEDPEVKYQAAVSLGLLESGVVEAMPILIDAMTDASHRYMAITVLENYGAQAAAAVPVLLKLLEAEPSEPSYYKLLADLKDGANVKKYLRRKYPDSQFLAALNEAGVDWVKVVMPNDNFKTLKLYWSDNRETKLEGLLPDNTGVYGYFSDYTRFRAAATLGAIGPEPGVVDALIGVINDDDSVVRQGAVTALGDLAYSTKNNIPLIIKRLKDKDDDVRNAAAEALGKFGPDAADSVPALIDALGDSSVNVRNNAIYSLGEIGPQAKAAIPALNKLIDKHEPPANPYAYDYYGRLIAGALIGIGPESGDRFAYLLELSNHANSDVQDEAMQALAEYGTDSIPHLLKFLGNDDPRVQFCVDGALVEACKKSPDAVQQLIPLLQGNDQDLGRRIAGIISEIGPAAKPAVHAILKILMSVDPKYGGLRNLDTTEEKIESSKLVNHYIYVLGDIGPGAADAVPLLTTFLASKNLDLRAAAMNALGKIGLPAARAIPIIIRNLYSDSNTMKLTAMQALGSFGPLARNAVPALMALLSDKDQNMRAVSVETLGAIGPAAKAALPALRKLAADDPSSLVRESAKKAIERIKGE